MENNQSLKNVSNRGLSLTTPNGGEQPWKTTRKSETQGRKPVTELTETGVDELGFSEYNVDSDEYEIIHKDVEVGPEMNNTSICRMRHEFSSVSLPILLHQLIFPRMTRAADVISVPTTSLEHGRALTMRPPKSR